MTTPDLGVLSDAIARYDAQWVTLLDQRDQQIEQQTELIAALQRLLARLGTRIPFGSTASPSFPGETEAQIIARLDAAYAPKILRYYDNGKGLGQAVTWAQQGGVLNQRPCILSFKPKSVFGNAFVSDPASDDNTVQAAKQITDPNSYVCPWHEQDAKIQQKVFTYAAYRAMWQHHVPLLKDNTPAKLIQIFTGWDIAKRIGQLMPDCDAIGIDPYANRVGQTAQSVIEPILQVIRKSEPNKPIVVCETGFDTRAVLGLGTAQATADYAASFTWLRDTAAKQYGVVGMSWFNSTDAITKVDYRIDNNPLAALAWKLLGA